MRPARCTTARRASSPDTPQPLGVEVPADRLGVEDAADHGVADADLLSVDHAAAGDHLARPAADLATGQRGIDADDRADERLRLGRCRIEPLAGILAAGLAAGLLQGFLQAGRL